MSLAIECPSCRGKLAISEENRGKVVRCPYCAGIMRVPSPTSVREVPARPSSIRKAPASDRRVVAAEKPPMVPARPQRETSEEPSRRKIRRPPREEIEQGHGKGARTWLLAGVAACGAVGLGLVTLGLVGVFALGSKPSKEEKPVALNNVQSVERPAAARPEQQPEQRPEPAAPQPVADPPPVEVPAGPVPTQLDAASLRKVKQATVYLRVNLPNDEIAQGSGFFSLVPGIVITNAHVLGMLRESSMPPVRVEVVLHSGELNERKLIGTVVGVDRSNDLAVLRVRGDGLPKPLAVASAGQLLETQKVYIFGFPLGAQLGKNITVSDSSVSSLRRDASGQLNQIQVNGGMHPGNSGGPVTDARGVVIGVAVAGIPGTQINFAIPGDLVKLVLDGRFDRSEWGMAYTSDNQVKLPVKMTCLDPLGRIRQVKIDVWTGAPGDSRPPSRQRPQPEAGDGPRTAVPAVFRGGTHTAEVPLPRPAPGQVCWFQPVLVKASGEMQWEKALPVPDESQIVLERQPARLQFQPPASAIERTLKAHSAVTITVYQGKESGSLRESMDGNVLESLNPDWRGLGTAIRLTLGDCSFRRVTPSKTVVPPAQAQAVLSQYSPTFLVNDSNACKERGNRNFDIIAPAYRDIVESMYETICNTYEETTLPLPNRTVQPLETWQAQIPMLVLIRGKRQVQDIFVTCTYEGVRSESSRREAYIGLSGAVKGRGPRADLVLGKARGHALFDVEKGFLTLVTLTVRSELENEEAGVRILVSDESTIRRSESNRLGIRAATRNQPGAAPEPKRMPRRR
jgi:S1-C subfamily serine protease